MGAHADPAEPAAGYSDRQHADPSPAPASRIRDGSRPRHHGHLWRLADGTGLHAPFGELSIDDDTGRLACHLCGRWYVSLGAHVRVHGHTADSYREAMGLCATQPLAAAVLSHSISQRQARAYRHDENLRRRLADSAQLRRSGELNALARAALKASDPPQRAARRRAALAAGRQTRMRERERRLAQIAADAGFASIDGYLRAAYRDGASLDSLVRDLSCGRAWLRAELAAAGVQLRGPGQNTRGGKRSRAWAAEQATARRVGTDDLIGWLARRRAAGWSLSRLAVAVGHSTHWVRWRLAGEKAETSRWAGQ